MQLGTCVSMFEGKLMPPYSRQNLIILALLTGRNHVSIFGGATPTFPEPFKTNSSRKYKEVVLGRISHVAVSASASLPSTNCLSERLTSSEFFSSSTKSPRLDPGRVRMLRGVGRN